LTVVHKLVSCLPNLTQARLMPFDSCSFNGRLMDRAL